MIEIKNRWSNTILLRDENATTLLEAVSNAVARGANLRDADLGYADLRGASLRDADLRGANLRGANLRDADLGCADLGYADLRGASLRDADLRGANLRGANLRDADLGDANLRGANLRGANLRDADLGDANLRDADLRGANLRDADLGDANLRGANLRDADLGDADLGGADLRDADLGGANLRGIRDDVWAVLDAAPGEVPGLLTALREGRIDGTVYSGECACLVGTIANLRGCSTGDLPESIQPDSSRPAEQWFLGIRPGDFPAHSQIARITDEWIVEWLGKHGVTVESSIDPGKAVAFARANLEAFQAFGGPRAS